MENSSNYVKIERRGRINKNIQYAAEQQGILQRINNILGINENNKVIYVYDLENNGTKQQQIYDLIPDIRKYFVCGEWPIFSKNIKTYRYMSIVKGVYKSMSVKWITAKKNIVRNNETVRSLVYILL